MKQRSNTSGGKSERRRRIVLAYLATNGPAHITQLCREVLDEPDCYTSLQNMRRLCTSLQSAGQLSQQGGKDTWTIRAGHRLCECGAGVIPVTPKNLKIPPEDSE